MSEQRRFRADEYVPTTEHDDRIRVTFGLVLVPLRPCPLCGRLMVEPADASTGREAGYGYGATPSDQLRRAGWVLRGTAVAGPGKTICRECQDQGRASFVCARCHDARPTSAIKWSTGYPAEHLCRVCYETAPAKEWHELKKRLIEEHRYDSE